MQRVVIDTNCLVASINPNSSYYRLYTAFAAEAFEWVVSNEILTEYEEILSAYYSAGLANKVLSTIALAPNTHFQEAYYKWQLITADPDDNKFVDVAVAANADLLVTNDRHFDVLQNQEFPRMSVLTLQAFLATFE